MDFSFNAITFVRDKTFADPAWGGASKLPIILQLASNTVFRFKGSCQCYIEYRRHGWSQKNVKR